jgi:hypothetical protein
LIEHFDNACEDDRYIESSKSFMQHVETSFVRPTDEAKNTTNLTPIKVF